MQKSINRAFTLIELLVVIAIIGVLSAVVLAALNSARMKGYDAAVRENLMSIRSQAQLYFHENGSYGPVNNIAVVSDCAATDNMFSDATVIAQLAAVSKANQNGTITCNVAADGSTYAVSAALVSTPGTFYCADSTGVATTSSATLGVSTQC